MGKIKKNKTNKWLLALVISLVAVAVTFGQQFVEFESTSFAIMEVGVVGDVEEGNSTIKFNDEIVMISGDGGALGLYLTSEWEDEDGSDMSQIYATFIDEEADVGLISLFYEYEEDEWSVLISYPQLELNILFYGKLKEKKSWVRSKKLS